MQSNRTTAQLVIGLIILLAILGIIIAMVIIINLYQNSLLIEKSLTNNAEPQTTEPNNQTISQTDTDGDGLSDDLEAVLGTDPKIDNSQPTSTQSQTVPDQTDSDSDGLSDNLE